MPIRAQLELTMIRWDKGTEVAARCAQRGYSAKKALQCLDIRVREASSVLLESAESRTVLPAPSLSMVEPQELKSVFFALPDFTAYLIPATQFHVLLALLTPWRVRMRLETAPRVQQDRHVPAQG